MIVIELTAEVAELADAPDSGSGARKGVEVQVLSSALRFSSAKQISCVSCRGTRHLLQRRFS
jgi:hypothetical protein